MKLKFGTTSVLLTETEEKFKLELDLEKLRGKTKSVALLLAFSATTVLACAGFIWLSLGIFCTLVVLLLVNFFRTGISYSMDFELDPELGQAIMKDLLEKGR